MAVATSFAVLNYSGMLFNKGNTRTPLSSLIGGKVKTTNHVEFVTGQEYTVGGGSQPAISETASLTAPTTSFVTRAQKTNVTQIFQEAFGVSYGKQANMGTLSGLNVENQQANPMSEFDFQLAARMQKIANDVEYTFINGVFQKAANDGTANKTRGLLAACGNELKMNGALLTLWDIARCQKILASQNAPVDNLVLLCDAATMLQINYNASVNGLTIVPADRTINGINLASVITPMGVVYLLLGAYLPSGTAILMNPDVLAPVYQPVPGKGLLFCEPLAKTGAGDTYQIYGEIGFDHGPGWFHCKITGISTAMPGGATGATGATGLTF